MKRFIQFVFLCTAISGVVCAQCGPMMKAPAQPKEHTVDRIVVVVHDNVITESDWDEEERVTALLEGTAPEIHSHTATTLNRLIERTLVLEQMTSLEFKRSTPQEIESELTSVKKQIPGADDPAKWQAMIARYGVSEDQLNHRLGEQRDTLRFLDVKFRSGIHITQSEIETYYNEVLIPQLQAKKAMIPPLAEVRGKIAAILTEQRMNAMLDDWIRELKANGDIRWLAPVV
jgi:peptidyl-prolyl cis-trans isomerase SurA